MTTPDEATPRFDVLFEDNHLLAVNKPAGMLSQGDGTDAPDILTAAKAYIKEKYAKPGAVYLGLVHRLDRNVGGVMLLARTSKAAARLSKTFQDRRVRKIYAAAVQGRPARESDELVDHIRKDEARRLALIAPAGSSGAREARLRYTVQATVPAPDGLATRAQDNRSPARTKNEISLLEVEILTGRFHQIRAQLAGLGHPILGDKKYGARSGLPNWALTLFASRLVLSHPVGGTDLVIEAAPEWLNIFTD